MAEKQKRSDEASASRSSTSTSHTVVQPGPHTAAKIRLRRRMQKIKPWQWMALFMMSAVWLLMLLPDVSHKKLTAKDIESMPVPVDEDRERTLQRINKHLQYVEKQRELSAMDAQLQTYEMARQIDGRSAQVPTVDLSAYERPRESQAEKNVFEDLNKGPERNYDTPMTPEERINANLAMQRWLKDYEEHQTHQYVQEFLENARRQGLEVRINDKLEIVDIRPIPKEQRYKGLQSIRGLSSQ